jgi:hypothetical protein
MSEMTGDAYSESLRVIKTIKQAWESGHTLVPLLGAGVSVDSGMPLVDSIMEYLVMIREYVKTETYRPHYDALPYGDIDKEYRDHPIRYIRHYGWPDRFQLRHELMLHHAKTHPVHDRGSAVHASENTFDTWISKELDNRVSALKKWQKEQYEELVREVRHHNPKYKIRSTWEILGDWRAVIREFTEFTLDDADSLFERLYRWHKPGRSHHFWAFLTRLMGLRLFLTTNFDNFLERAFTEQGIDHRVFGVEHGDNLPHESLVRETVSVIKLHGDTHQLLLDEKLDYAPSIDYLQRLQACMPKRPILVVMGCGGNDPRILEVVKSHVACNRIGGFPGVIWLHFEEGIVGGRTLETELGSNIQHARVTNPGLFLSHLYAHLRSQHPASRVPYQTHLSQPIAPLRGDGSRAISIQKYQNRRENVFIYSQRKTHEAGPAASQVMADLVYAKKTKQKYTPIWINLEAHQSVAGVVQQIVERCRVHDTFVSPFDVPSSKTDRELTAALTAERLFHILRRGRYVLAFDALEAFLWPPIAHHGVSKEQVEVSEFEHLFALLKKLMTHEKLEDQIDVVLCASFDLPKGRRTADGGSNVVECFSDLVKELEVAGADDGSTGDSCDVGEHADTEDLFVISCFRRPRSLVSLCGIFFDVFRDKPCDAENRIDRLIASGHLVPIEGGYFRIRRSERDDVYSRRSEGTSAADIRAVLREGSIDPVMEAIAKCYSLTSTHGLIARCYYADSYLHSLDSWVFLEYFYHRVTSLRYITKLAVLLDKASDLDQLHRTLRVMVPPASVNKDKRRDSEHDLRSIRTYVKGERVALQESLRHALSQAQDHLLRGLPAAHVEAWCRGGPARQLRFHRRSEGQGVRPEPLPAAEVVLQRHDGGRGGRDRRRHGGVLDRARIAAPESPRARAKTGCGQRRLDTVRAQGAARGRPLPGHHPGVARRG